MAEGRSWGSGSLGKMGSAGNWEEVLKDLKRREVKRVRIFVTDDLPGKAIRKISPEAE